MKLHKHKLLLVFILIFFIAFVFAKSPFPNTNQVIQRTNDKGNTLVDLSFVNPLVNFGHYQVLPAPLSFTNLAPIASAGKDTSITLPVDFITLQGCASADPEMAELRYKWIKIAGPGAHLLEEDSLCSAPVKGLIEGVYSFELTVTDTAGLTNKDTVLIAVNSLFSVDWPMQVIPLSSKPYKVVVIGSSTTYGTGANPIDSSWVSKLTTYLTQQNSQVSLINLALPGFTSYHLSPTGTVVPSNWSITVDTIRNITKALSLKPDAIILNLPSNDVGQGFSLSEIQNNYDRIKAAAETQHVPIWITTTQPRDYTTSKKLLQMDLRDWIMNRFGKKAVDFWSTVSNPDGSVKQYFSAGDGIHLNNPGHHVLFKRIVEEKIWDTVCINKNLCPVAKAGNDTIVIGSPASVTLDATASYDPDGTITSYDWVILNDSVAIITGANTAQPVFSFLTPMNYTIELTLTDNLGSVSKDTIRITVNPAVATTYVFTGNGNWNVASNWSNNSIPPAVLSGNSIILIDPLVNGECILNVPQKIMNGSILKIMENKKLKVAGGIIMTK